MFVCHSQAFASTRSCWQAVRTHSQCILKIMSKNCNPFVLFVMDSQGFVRISQAFIRPHFFQYFSRPIGSFSASLPRISNCHIRSDIRHSVSAALHIANMLSVCFLFLCVCVFFSSRIELFMQLYPTERFMVSVKLTLHIFLSSAILISHGPFPNYSLKNHSHMPLHHKCIFLGILFL